MELIKPEWIKVRYRTNDKLEAIKEDVKRKGLSTVCQEARCPNIWECWHGGTATFMLMGDTCTRGCAFCSVKTARNPSPLDPDEPRKLLESIKRMKLSYVVLTTVDRDDLPDQGANHLAGCIRYLKKHLPKLRIEMLIGDFQGERSLLKKVVDAKPDVLAHNIETVERLTRKVRDRRAGYRQSLEVLKAIKEVDPEMLTKSSIMVGFGEREEEIAEAMDHLRAVGVDFLTVGQYLQPSRKQAAVKEYVPTATFKYYEKLGKTKGFAYVASGPFVRSSYKAGELYIKALLDEKEVHTHRTSQDSGSGRQADRGAPHLSDDDIRHMYWHMNLSRQLNAKILSLQKQGRIGTYASILGQEGCQVGLAYAIRDHGNVWLVPSFRETAVLITRGYPMDQIMQYWGGDERGSIAGAKLKVMPVSIPIGSQCNHAVGIGMSMQVKKEQGASIAFVGDGGTSEGETLESMNFAGLFKAPTIFFVQNNQYAISVPRSKQTASETIAEKAGAFGFEGVQVDGNDVFAAYKVVRDAVAKALRGDGPTLIEAVTYRVDNHTTADDWKKYRTDEEVKEWQAKDPILRLRKYMEGKGIWDDDHEKGMLDDAKKNVDEAVKKYMDIPKPKPEEMFDYLYEKMPPLLEEQKKSLGGAQ